MKNLINIASISLLFLSGVLSGWAFAQDQKEKELAALRSKVTLFMYDENGLMTSRTYQGITSWNYKMVDSEPRMELGFVNPTVYRCGFEP